MAYDKGTPGSIIKIGAGKYEVASWRDVEKAYIVDLSRDTCTCPVRGSCKHLTAARAARFEGLVEKAKALPQTELEALLPQYEAAQQLDIAVAIRAELQTRQQAESRDAQLRAIFA